ncbi:MAG: hypothetical protein JNL57_08555 [Bacteroidetes bacterium]|nr:hypothetical protein [Bacteroidota bacterium]
MIKKVRTIIGAIVIISFGLFILIYLSDLNTTKARTSKLKIINQRPKYSLSTITNLFTYYRNPNYFIYVFQAGKDKIHDTFYYGSSLPRFKTGFTELAPSNKILVIYKSDSPMYHFPILRKSWIEQHKLLVPIDYIGYIPFE